MNVWFYAQDEERKGPISQDELLAKFSAGELTPQSLVWCKGMPEWLPAAQTEGLLVAPDRATATATIEPPLTSRAPDFAVEVKVTALPGEAARPVADALPSLRTASSGPSVFMPTVTVGPAGAVPTLEARSVKWTAFEQDQTELGGTGPQRRPWPRYFARSIDGSLVGFAFGMLAVVAGFGELLESRFVTGALGMLVLCFIEAALLSIWGTTPGKWLFNIRVSRSNGRLLSYGEALKRAFGVYVFGMGLGLPVVSLFTLGSSYNKLTNEGTTRWDQGTDTVVCHQELSGGKIVLGVIATMICFSLIGYGLAAAN